MKNWKERIVEALEKAGFTPKEVQVSENGNDVVIKNKYIPIKKIQDIVFPISTVVIVPGTCYNDTVVRREFPFSMSGDFGYLNDEERYFPQSFVDEVSNKIWEFANKAEETGEPVEIRINLKGFECRDYFIKSTGRQTFEVFSDEDTVPFEIEFYKTFSANEGWRIMSNKIADEIYENILNRAYWIFK